VRTLRRVVEKSTRSRPRSHPADQPHHQCAQSLLSAGSGVVSRQGLSSLRRPPGALADARGCSAARKDTLEAFFRTSNVRRTATIKRRIDAIREERPLHSDDAVTIPARMLVDALLPQLRALSASIARFDEEIAASPRSCPTTSSSLPCPALARRSLRAYWRPSASGERFPDAAALQKFAGITPVIERSGNKSWVHWRYSCSKFLRQTFVEWAAQTIPRSFWAKAFYDSHRARGHDIRLRFARSPSSGSESSTAAGSIASPTTSPATSWLSRSDPPRYSNTPLKPAADSSLRSASGRELASLPIRALRRRPADGQRQGV
jgi:hypothetical protein